MAKPASRRPRRSPQLRLARAPRLLAPALAALLVAAGVGGCGSGGGGSAAALLRQTFSGHHQLTSGRLALGLVLAPGGSRTLSGPITLSFGGPFQSRGTGALPVSDFTLSASALGRSGALRIISTGTAGYVALSGVSYQLPAASFRQLEASFAGLAGGSGASRQSALARLGINPLNWLRAPTVIGPETIAGAPTTHVRAAIATRALLADVNRFAGRAAALGTPVPGNGQSLPPATLDRIAAAIRNPSLDVWTGTRDHTLRRLEVRMSIPVSGRLQATLAGLSSVGVDFTLAYSEINQPQTVTAPTAQRPFAEFQTKLRAFLGQISSAASLLGGGAVAPSAAPATPAPSTTTPGAGAATTAYGRCINSAQGDVSKMQACASLLGTH